MGGGHSRRETREKGGRRERERERDREGWVGGSAGCVCVGGGGLQAKGHYFYVHRELFVGDDAQVSIIIMI